MVDKQDATALARNLEAMRHKSYLSMDDQLLIARAAAALRATPQTPDVVREALEAAREYIGLDNNPRSNRVLGKIYTALSTPSASAHPQPQLADGRGAVIEQILAGYADSYRMMANDGDGKVLASSVHTDLLCNIKPAIARVLQQSPATKD